MVPALIVFVAGTTVSPRSVTACANRGMGRTLRGRMARWKIRWSAFTGRRAWRASARLSLRASGLYRDAIASLFNLPDRAFAERGTTVLPVGSFSGLWKYVVPAALKCDPGLAAMAENQRARERMIAERTGANATLRRARELLNDKTMLDRAAQVAGAAIEAGDPDTLDFSLLASVLSGLNGGAPDLSDDLFARPLDFVMSEQAPSPDSLQSLAKFLFGGPKPGDKLDEDQSGGTYTISGATVENLTGTRPAANPDNIEALIDTTLRLLDVPAAVNRNPVVAYALGYQLLPRAKDLMPTARPIWRRPWPNCKPRTRPRRRK